LTEKTYCENHDAHDTRHRKKQYNQRWRQESKLFLLHNPLCADPFGLHAAAGVRVVAREVDHKTPWKGNTRLFWERSNWQSLCESCHSKKTAKFDRLEY
jgi:5-methylcytosine-specific restriction protein A